MLAKSLVMFVRSVIILGWCLQVPTLWVFPSLLFNHLSVRMCPVVYKWSYFYIHLKNMPLKFGKIGIWYLMIFDKMLSSSFRIGVFHWSASFLQRLPVPYITVPQGKLVPKMERNRKATDFFGLSVSLGRVVSNAQTKGAWRHSRKNSSQDRSNGYYWTVYTWAGLDRPY